MSPPFIFRIDEIRESSTAPIIVDAIGNWIPSTDRGANVRVSGAGATGIWWFCNRQSIQRLDVSTPPQGSRPYSTFSVFYADGFGFWVLRGDATNPLAAEAWQPLWFDHDDQDYSSYLTNAGTARTLRCQRSDQRWPAMLLPSVNQVSPIATGQGYGGLKGELAIFLALIAFSMDERHLRDVLPRVFINGAWATHLLPHGRKNKRGVVVWIYTCPPTWGADSSADELASYEEGEYGNYYN